ncbi:MAG: hypothetical protein DWI58_02575 [Chloroflexi bacterium]|nr:MAG: hypothetical protein DWI58_02575 [Chloroflexota bacterium]
MTRGLGERTMSRLPTPDPGWRESTEGDRDADLTEEAGSDLEDWDNPYAPPRTSWATMTARAMSVVLLLIILGGVAAEVLLAR